MKDKFNKDQLAVLLVVGLVVAVMMIGAFFQFSGKKNTEAENEISTFQSPDGTGSQQTPVVEDSQEDLYGEETDKEENSSPSLNLNFDEIPVPKIVDTTTQKPIPEPSSIKVQPVQRSTYQTAPSKSKPKEQQVSVPVEPEYRRRGFNSAPIAATQSINNASENMMVIVHEGKTVKEGDPIKLRLIKDATINKFTLPAGSVIEGIAFFRKDRLDIIVSDLEINGELTATHLIAYSNGRKGLPATTSVNQEIANDAVKQASGGFRVNIPIIGGSVSSDGLKRKATANENNAYIPSNYNLILKYEPQNH